MAVANKNNFGYITPEDFNLYAKQAQLDLFEDYIFRKGPEVETVRAFEAQSKGKS